jgi:hypothetical protein
LVSEFAKRKVLNKVINTYSKLIKKAENSGTTQIKQIATAQTAQTFLIILF